MCDITHFLLFIVEEVIWLPFTKCAMSLTSYKSLEKMWRDCISQNVQYHSQAISHRKQCHETGFHKMCDVTHWLLVIGKDMMRSSFTKCAISDSLAICHSKDAMRLPFTKCVISLTSCEKMCQWWVSCLSQMFNVTHSLLVIGKAVISFTKCAMSLTSCWSQGKMGWDSLSQNVQCHWLTRYWS